ncbi:E3 ubiquitin-protein ligase TRIM8 isoform X2 [Anguilla rostrata]|uniref:E3 ubiquitin-protein ligase TRIM8 isoform X2 n=1 Tax=Anguilla anguilla TaxID=7936 RepID=UPI0015AA97F2|nr:E3 ubiquitin-protein ligase TRIM8 isoform X2 [Anguilla anguilla]
MAGPVEESVLEGELTCPVCLDLFSDPHLLACGHNLCLACVRGLRRRAERGRFRCPECRESLRCGGPLQKNYRLANIAEDYRRRGRPCRQAPPPPPVHCDYCSPGAAAPAVKTCLQCEVSMCAEHVRPHLERPAFREHPLTEPLGDVRERKCAAHDEAYRYYCLDQRVFVCNACTIEGQHAGHTIKTLKNTMKDLKESLQVQGQRLSRKVSRTERFLQQRADAERDSQRFVEGAEQHLRVVGEQLQVQLGGFLSALRECVRAHSGAGPGAELQLSFSRITEDRAHLQQAQTSLQALLQENDPFHFLQEYHSTEKKVRKALKRPLFSPGSLCLETEALAEIMEAKLEEFQTEFRLQITELIQTVFTPVTMAVCRCG